MKIYFFIGIININLLEFKRNIVIKNQGNYNPFILNYQLLNIFLNNFL